MYYSILKGKTVYLNLSLIYLYLLTFRHQNPGFEQQATWRHSYFQHRRNSPPGLVNIPAMGILSHLTVWNKLKLGLVFVAIDIISLQGYQKWTFFIPRICLGDFLLQINIEPLEASCFKTDQLRSHGGNY